MRRDDLADQLLALPPDEIADVVAKSRVMGARPSGPTEKCQIISMNAFHDEGRAMRKVRDDLDELGRHLEGLTKTFGSPPHRSEAVIKGIVAKIDQWLRVPMPMPYQLAPMQPPGSA